MTEKRLDVYLLAEPRAGFDRTTLAQNLAALFKKDVAAIEKMLCKTHTLIKADVDATTAAKYQKAIQHAGGHCDLSPHGEVPLSLAPPSSAARPDAMKVEPLAVASSPVVAKPSASRTAESSTAVDSTKVHSSSAHSSAADVSDSGKLLSRIVLGFAVLGLLGLIAAVALPAYQKYVVQANNPPATGAAENTRHSKSDKQQTPGAMLQTSLRTYSDDKTISLTTPSSWKGERRLNPQAAIGVANLRENVYAVVLRENKTDFGGTFDLQHYSELIAQGLEKSTQEFYVQEAPRKLSIGGVAAQQAALAAKVDGIKIIYVITTLETAEHFYVIYAWTLASQFAAQHVLLKEVSESFTVH